jgi:O-antigen/teichoic acid export membrane protein
VKDDARALATQEVRTEGTAPSGTRSGLVVAGASLLGMALNYAFLLAAGRVLGADDYGALAALLGLLTVVLLPTGAVQLAVSREVSRRITNGDEQGANAFAYGALRLGLIATVPLVALALLLVVPLREVLKIDSTIPVVLTALGLVTALAFPVAIGVLQGRQRFHAVGVLFVLPFVLRLALFAPLAWLGFRLGGAVYAAVAGGVACTAAAVGLLIDPLRRGARASREALGPFLRYLMPVVIGLIGVAVLTNVDLIIVKARFSGEEAGDYAAASAFARVAFFLPATILAVLFPRTAARQARGEDTADILGRSLLASAGFCGLLVLLYAAAGRGLVHSTFGAEFAEGGELLVPFTVALSLYALANVLVGFHLSRGETRYAWIAASAVGAQILALLLAPGGVLGLIWTNVAVAAALLAVHELLVGSSVPALRAGLGHLRESLRLRRAAILEAALVVMGTSAFVAVLMWPLTSKLGSATIGTEGSDSAGGVAWFWQLQQEGAYHLFGTTRHVLTGAPFGWEEANGLNLQFLLPYYPGYLATKVVGEVVAFNLVVLSGYVFSGVAMYLLTRYLGCAPLVSGWAALVYVVFPWHLERAQHGALLHLEVLAFLLLALLAAAKRPSWLRFALVGLATLACWLTFGYFGVMAAIGATAFAVGAGAAFTSRRSGIGFAVGVTTAAFVATLVMGFLTLAPGVDRGESLARDVEGLSVYGLRLPELVVPPAHNLLLDDRLEDYHATHLHGSNVTEATNFVGLLTLGLAAAWLVVAWRRRRQLTRFLRVATAGLVALVVVGLLLALPSPLTLFGFEWTWTPSRALFEVISAFRAPARWTVLVMTALVPLAALTLHTAWTALARRSVGTRSRRLAPYALVGVASVVSFLELAIPPARPIVRSDPAPALYDAVAQAPAGILAEYPLKNSTISIYWQREHGRPLLNGAGAGTYASNVARTLVNPRAPGTAAKLALLGVTAIVSRPGALDYKSEATPDIPGASWGAGYTLLGRYPDGSSVWRVSARPAPALPIFARRDFEDPLDPRDGFVGYPLSGSSGRIELSAPTRRVVRLQFDAVPTSQAPLSLHLTGAIGELTVPLSGATRVSALVQIPQGRSLLVVAVEPTPAPGVVPVELSAPWTERASGRSVVRAAPVGSSD